MPHGSIHQSQILTNFSVRYFQENFLWPNFPVTPVTKETDNYYVYGQNFRIPFNARANGAPANMISHDYSTSSYSLVEYALKDIVTDRDRDNADKPLQLDKDVTENLTENILRRVEYQTSVALFTTGSWGNNTSLATASSWDYTSTTGSAPIQNVLSATMVIAQYSGKMPNTMIVGREVYEALKENNNIYTRIQYVQKAILTKDLLASIFDVQNVLVGINHYDTSQEGETASYSDIWGDNALICYLGPQGVKNASAFKVFMKTKHGNPLKVKKWREEERAGDFIEVSTMSQAKVVASLCGYYFSSCTAV